MFFMGFLSVFLSVIWGSIEKIPKIKEYVENNHTGQEAPEKDIWVKKAAVNVAYFGVPTAVYSASIFSAVSGYHYSAGLTVLLLCGFVVFFSRRYMGLDWVDVFRSLAFLLVGSIFIAFVVALWAKLLGVLSITKSTFTAYLIIAAITLIVIEGAAIALKPYPGFFRDGSAEGRRALWMGMVGFVVVVVLTFSLGANRVSKVIVANYGVGGIENAEIVLNSDGMAAMQLAGIPCKCQKSNKFCKISSVSILWMRGEEYVLYVPMTRDESDNTEMSRGVNGESSGTRVIIPSRAVVSVIMPMTRT